MPHHLLIYTLAPDYLDRRPTYRDRHLTLAWAAADRGDLVLGGAIEKPVDTALLLFATAGAAEAFARADPYVVHGLVADWRVRPWRTVVGAHAADPVRPA